MNPADGTTGQAGGSAAPFSHGTDRPAFAVPEGACDCHMHLFDNAWPYAGPGVLTHADATPQDYRALQRRLAWPATSWCSRPATVWTIAYCWRG